MIAGKCFQRSIFRLKRVSRYEHHRNKFDELFSRLHLKMGLKMIEKGYPTFTATCLVDMHFSSALVLDIIDQIMFTM